MTKASTWLPGDLNSGGDFGAESVHISRLLAGALMAVERLDGSGSAAALELVDGLPFVIELWALTCYARLGARCCGERSGQ